MTGQRAEGAVIEIIERRAPDPNDLGIIVPDEIRINGQALLCPSDHPVKVHEVTIGDSDVVQVTLTLFARRVFIGTEDPTQPLIAE